MRLMKQTAITAMLVAALCATTSIADNIPGANRGHVGAINTGALGRMLVGNGANGFAEQNPPRDCALSMTNADALECATISTGLPADACGSLVNDGSGNKDWDPTVYIKPIFHSGKPSAGQVVYFANLDDSLEFGANFNGCEAQALDGATSDAVYNIYLSQTGPIPIVFDLVGTLTFPGGENGHVQINDVWDYIPDNDPVTISSTKWIKIVAPASQDATLSDVSLQCTALRTCGGG